jgi:hypothetical protein
MPNWSYTTAVVTGPDAEIERFKQACTFTNPTKDFDGIDFDRVIPRPRFAYWRLRESTFDGLDEQDRPRFRMVTAYGLPSPIFEAIAVRFPALTLNIRSFDEQCSYSIRGTISACGFDLSEDEETR